MSRIRFYHSGMTGAPSLVWNNNSSVRALLKACLVDGFGSQDPAGWTEVFTGTSGTRGVSVFRSPISGAPFLQVSEDNVSNNAEIRFRAFGDMTDALTGTGPFPSNAQEANGLRMWKNSNSPASPRAWYLLASTEMVFFVASLNNSALDFVTTKSGIGNFTGTNHSGSMLFGRFNPSLASDTYNWILLGGKNNWFDNPLQLNYRSGSYVWRNYMSDAGVGSTIIGVTGGGIVADSNTGSSDWPSYPSPITQGIVLGPSPLLMERVSGTREDIRGSIRGFRRILTDMIAPVDRRFDTFEGTGSLSGRTFMIIPAPGSSGSSAACAIELTDTSNCWSGIGS